MTATVRPFHDGVPVQTKAAPQSALWPGFLRSRGTTGKLVELWALHTSRRLPSAKVCALVDFMRDQCPDGELVVQG